MRDEEGVTPIMLQSGLKDGVSTLLHRISILLHIAYIGNYISKYYKISKEVYIILLTKIILDFVKLN